VSRENGIGENAMDKIVWTKSYKISVDFNEI